MRAPLAYNITPTEVVELTTHLHHYNRSCQTHYSPSSQQQKLSNSILLTATDFDSHARVDIGEALTIVVIAPAVCARIREW